MGSGLAQGHTARQGKIWTQTQVVWPQDHYTTLHCLAKSVIILNPWFPPKKEALSKIIQVFPTIPHCLLWEVYMFVYQCMALSCSPGDWNIWHLCSGIERWEYGGKSKSWIQNYLHAEPFRNNIYHEFICESFSHFKIIPPFLWRKENHNSSWS